MRCFLVLIGCLIASGTFAQAPKPQPPAADTTAPAATPPISNVPQSTSASYGDWVLVCQREPEPSTVRLCEVSQSVQVQGQQQPIAQIAISKSKTPPAVNLTVVLPPNITLTSGPRVSVDEKDTQVVDLAWLRCLPGGCFASAIAERAGRHGDLQEAVAIEIERRALAGTEADAAERHRDGAGVGDGAAEEGDEAARAGTDATGVADRGGTTPAVEVHQVWRLLADR